MLAILNFETLSRPPSNTRSRTALTILKQNTLRNRFTNKEQVDELPTPAYDREVLEDMKKKEKEMIDTGSFLTGKQCVTPALRATAVNWIVKAHLRMQLHTDTLFTAVDLMDHYLTVAHIERSQLQLLCCASLFVAAKNEEVSAPSAVEFAQLTKYKFSVFEITQMEKDLLQKVEWRVSPVHSSHFLKRFVRFAVPSADMTMLAYFVNETALLDERMRDVTPSLRAAAAVCLAVRLIQYQWTPVMTEVTGYDAGALQGTVDQLLSAVHRFNSSKFDAVRVKYRAKAMRGASDFDFPESISLV